MQTPDADWPDVVALQGGEDAALDRLMERHRGPLLGFVARMIGNAQDAEEIAQETFVRAYFQIQKYHPKAPFAAWLYQIARNLSRDYFRSRSYKQDQASSSLEVLPVEPAQERIGADGAQERIEAVQAALLRVPLKFRESLILTAIEGLSHAEAGMRLGLTAKAVEVRCHRARAILAKVFKKESLPVR